VWEGRRSLPTSGKKHSSDANGRVRGDGIPLGRVRGRGGGCQNLLGVCKRHASKGKVTSVTVSGSFLIGEGGVGGETVIIRFRKKAVAKRNPIVGL